MNALLFRRIKTARREKGYNQVTLARQAGITQATLSRIENNQEKPHLNTLVRLAQALDLDLAQFFTDEVASPQKLNRHELEAVARAILSGERKLKPRLNRAADQAASLMTQFLNAHAVSGRFKVRGLRWRAPFRKERVLSQLGEETFNQIFSRVGKWVAIYEEKSKTQ